VADDKRDGDDLFEDLDKFFAPIKDVEWDEPASSGARSTPSEEHVAVRPGQPSAESEDLAAASDETQSAAHEEDEDEEWYDTTVLETIGEIEVEDDLGQVTPAAPDALGGDVADDVVSLNDEASGDDVTAAEPADQGGLFAGGEVGDAGWGTSAEGDLDTDTAPMSTIEEDVVVATPSEEDLEAAAQHFAPSIRDDDEYEGSASSGPDEPDAGAGSEADAGPVVGAELLDETEPAAIEQDILSDLDAGDEEPQTVMVGTGEGLGGPSWQEPGAMEVGSDAERRGPGPGERDVPAAFLTGVVLAGVALAALLIGRGVFGVIASAVVLLAQGELFGVMVRHHRQPATAVGLVAGALMLGGAYFKGEGAVMAMFALGVVATFLWFMSGPAATRKDTAVNIGLTILNMAWIPLLAGYLLITLKTNDGTSLVVAVIGLTFVYDTAAFLSGSVWGGQFFQRPLAPHVSPKKSIEGVIIGGLVTVVLSVTLVTSFVDVFEDKRIEALLLGVVIAAAATFGDLAESLVKRDMGIKDMSSLLPGHGGVLDRIDSLLFVAPATFLLFRILFD
jgi:phosphatidate cytidylyltransferase